jgi:hypothetical protein
MGLNADDIAWIDTLLGAPGAEAASLASVRKRFPGMSLTRCDPSDIGLETPFRSYEAFDLHLVDGSNHCWRLTQDPREATGLVFVARKRSAP